MLLTFVNKLVGVWTIAAQIALVVGIIYFVKHRKEENNSVLNFLSAKGDLFSALIVLGGIVVSLFYSRIAGFAPCFLCVLQRWFLYPQIIVIALGTYTKKVWAFVGAFVLSVLGAIAALYHNYIDYGGGDLFGCDALGAGISCAKRYVFEFGYVTIPMMSLTAFALIMFFLTLKTRKMCDNSSVTIQ